MTSYGEYIGLYPIRDVKYVSKYPLFSKSDYEVGSTIVWIDGEDVYEGEISTLYDPYARVVNVKKLMPINHVANVSYWKISEGRKSDAESTPKISQLTVGEDLNNGGEKPMSTKANIILRNEVSIRREIYLYQHADAHPNNLALVLAEMLRDAYIDFKELGDVDWFLSPSKLASFLVVKSVPSATDDMKQLMKKLPDSTRYQLESLYFLGMPTFIVENSRVSNCNYEYIITLSEDVENDFFGYELEVNKMNSNKLISTVMKHKENLLKEKTKSKA